ncbi:uncharacterized protein LOC144499139 [Mustelus asterias]
MNRDIHCLLKSRSKAFKSGDTDLYKKARYDLRRSIKDAKRQYRTKLESQASHTDPRHLWQGLQDITGYKMKAYKIAGSKAPLSDELNAFYVRFEQEVSESMPPTLEALDVSGVTTADVKSKVNPQKASGPDGVPGRALRSCMDQLAEVFRDIFNLSLQQSEVPIYFKKTTIIPIPKKNQAACLNDNRLVALTSIIMKCFKRVAMA